MKIRIAIIMNTLGILMLFCSCTSAENKIADCHIADAVITEPVKGIISKKETSSALQDKAEEVETNYEQWGNLSVEEQGESYTDASIGLFYDRKHRYLYLFEKKMKGYTEKLFLNLCKYPELINYCAYPEDAPEYYDAFSKLYWDSAEKFRQTDFPYEDAEWRYDWSETEWEEIIPEDRISASTTVTSHYTSSTEPEAKRWEIVFKWDYIIQDKLIRIKEIQVNPVKLGNLKDISNPIPKMTEKELAGYTEKLFLNITKYPEFFNDCAQVFEGNSRDLWEDMVWYYEEPEEFYDWSESWGIWEGDIYKGYTVVDSRFPYYELDLRQYPATENVNEIPGYDNFMKAYDGNLVKWAIYFEWSYSKKSGTIEINNYCLSPSTAQ